MTETTTLRNASSHRSKFTWKHLAKPFFFSLALLFALIGVSRGADRDSSSTPSLAPASVARDRMIFVSDFELDASILKQKQDRDAQAKKLVKLMSDSLVIELTKAGLKAQHLSPDDARPAGGLLLTGTFAQFDKGSHVRRALVGFGSGAAAVEVHASVADASQPEYILYELSAQKNSGKKPGAVIMPSPAAAVVKLAMTKNSPEKMVKKIAHQIATELSKQLSPEMLVAQK